MSLCVREKRRRRDGIDKNKGEIAAKENRLSLSLHCLRDDSLVPGARHAVHNG